MPRWAVAGKGGSGKTTISATLARVLARRAIPVIAVDGDSNPNLAVALGLAASLRNDAPFLASRGINRMNPGEGLDETAARLGCTCPDGVRLLIGVTVTEAGTG